MQHNAADATSETSGLLNMHAHKTQLEPEKQQCAAQNFCCIAIPFKRILCIDCKPHSQDPMDQLQGSLFVKTLEEASLVAYEQAQNRAE